MSFITNIEEKAKNNTNFREVLYTGKCTQLVVMSIAPGTDVGEEVHARVDQTLYIVSGVCEVVLDKKTSKVSAGEIIIVSPGTLHNFINKGKDDVKIITTYSPPNHLPDRIHTTYEDAVADEEDEAYSDEVNSQE